MQQRMAMIRDAYEREDGDSAVGGGAMQTIGENAMMSARNNPYGSAAALIDANPRSNFLEL